MRLPLQVQVVITRRIKIYTCKKKTRTMTSEQPITDSSNSTYDHDDDLVKYSVTSTIPPPKQYIDSLGGSSASTMGLTIDSLMTSPTATIETHKMVIPSSPPQPRRRRQSQPPQLPRISTVQFADHVSHIDTVDTL